MTWRAALRGLWSLAHLCRRFPSLPAAADAADVLETRLSAQAVEAERSALTADRHLARPADWAWLLRLEAELRRCETADGPGPGGGVRPGGTADVVAPLADAAAEHLSAWARDAGPYPRREGTGANSALAMLVALPPARASDRGTLAERLVSLARRWFLPDTRAPVAYEPSAADVVSPVLAETHLLGSVLDPPDFAEWYEVLLPGTAEVVPPRLGDPPVLGDPADPVAARRHTLTLTRAWSWRAIARALPARDERRSAALDAADRHLGAALEVVPADTLEVDHRAPAWLVLAAG